MTEPLGAAPAPAGAPNRLPIILGIGLGVLLLVFVATRFIGGGGGGDETTTTTTALGGEAAPAPTTTTTAPAGPPAETFEVFSTKNPFVPLRTLGGGPGGAPAPAGTGATGTGGTAGTGATTGGGTGTGTGTTPRRATGGVATEPGRTTRVALLDVFAEDGRTVANVRVGDTVHKVGEGDVFATNFKVVSLSQGDRCGRFLFGDDEFRLCRGEETVK